MVTDGLLVCGRDDLILLTDVFVVVLWDDLDAGVVVTIGFSSLFMSAGLFGTTLIGLRRVMFITEVGGMGVVVGWICGDCCVVFCTFGRLVYTGLLGVFFVVGVSSSGAKKSGGGGRIIPGTSGPAGTQEELSLLGYEKLYGGG